MTRTTLGAVATAVLLIQALVPVSGVRADDGRFTVLGWVKGKLSPSEEARSGQRRSTVSPQAPVMGGMAASSASLATPPPGMVSGGPLQMPQTTASMGMVAPPQAMMPSPLPMVAPPAPSIQAPGAYGPSTVAELRRRAEFLATRGLTYKFGADHPSEGGMDCSGTMQFLLKSIGYRDIPRTSYHQYEWLQKRGTLRKVGFFRSPERAIRDFRPGDLIFWGGTYNSGHKVSHVMVYLGRSRSGTHYIFGARGKSVKGLNGNGVDIFEYNPSSTGGRLVGYGRLPGLKDG